MLEKPRVLFLSFDRVEGKIFMSAKKLEDFFASFKRLDSEGMSNLYSDDATFTDEVFKLQGRVEISRMWTVLLSNIMRKGQETWQLSYVVESDTSVSWEATYLFSATGRTVTNKVRSKFVFNSDGKVSRQVDTFDFWRWSSQALGTVGILLGWSPLLKNKLRAKALDGLNLFSKQKGS